MFLPTTKKEMEVLGWEKADVIIVTGDAYIDSSFIGAAIIGKYLLSNGYKTAIISQPDINSGTDISRLGEPSLFWGVTAGCVDSIVSNYTSTLKKRHKDDFTPGGINNKRPDYASVVYSNLIRKYFKKTVPIVLGGIEASLRRIAHYDYLKDAVKRSILFDAKADYLVYGMGEKSSVEIASKLSQGLSPIDIPGLCHISNEKPKSYTELVSFNDVKDHKEKFTEMFMQFEKNSSLGLCQKQDTRYLIQNPAMTYTTKDLDQIYSLHFERDVHPIQKKQGTVKALETIKYSITSHRGCFGACNFCAISAHQGRDIINRSENSIIEEIKEITKLPNFKGNISDIGGPTANMYGLTPGNISHARLINLLKKARSVKGIKKIFISSGIRYDLIMRDKEFGIEYLKEIANHHVSGQLKIAPEHTEENILKLMGKPGIKYLQAFKKEFEKLSFDAGKKQFLTYYFIAAHPGCTEKDMLKTKEFALKELKILPEQVQVFTPTPSTYSTLMYHTEKNPFNKSGIFVEKNIGRKEKQKNILQKITRKN
ncbi:MAG: hypothetical protein ACD_79C00705G0001 [uncultured bacterium]|nr:MAG: hypothetical protein ACD_79C00705G0001 [uncultured bacterium]